MDLFVLFLYILLYWSQYRFYRLFFFKQHTAYDMRISYWSSDVCSSDLAICVSLAAGAASQRDTYRRSVYTPRGSFPGYYSAPSAICQRQAAASTAGTGYAIYNVQQRLDQTRRDLADTVVQLSTVDPDRSYGGKIVLAKIMDKKLPKIVTINLDWNGERYPFSFRLVKPGTPAPVYTNLAAVTPQTPDAGMVVGAADAAAAGAPGSPASATEAEWSPQAVPVALDAELASAAQSFKAPMAFMEKTTVSKVRADGKSLVMTALVDQEGAVVTENGRRQIIRKRSEEHTSELQSLMRNSYAVFCLKKK